MRVGSLRFGFFLLLLILVSLSFYGLVQEFLMPLFWAAVLAVAFRPAYDRAYRALGGRASLASLLTVLLIIVVAVVPLAFVSVALVNEASNIYARIDSGDATVMRVIDTIEAELPVVREFLLRFGVTASDLQEWITNAAVAISQAVGGQALVYTQGALAAAVSFFLMLYVLFFLVRDGETILGHVIRALPLGDNRERLLLYRFANVSRATLKGTIIVAIVQGVIGGASFWLLGITSAVFWGVVMTVPSLLPAIGTALVWIPAAIILVATGSPVKAFVLVLIGTFVIGLVDNILRPILVGRDTAMPDWLVLVATLGGLTIFGLSGFVIGPIIAALFLTVWDLFADEHAQVDEWPLSRLVRPRSPQKVARDTSEALLDPEPEGEEEDPQADAPGEGPRVPPDSPPSLGVPHA
jgi:predicted PurR-regulated permease PerM